MTTSENVVCEAQLKNFYIYFIEKTCSAFEVFKSVNLENYDVMMSVSTPWTVYFWVYLVNRTPFVRRCAIWYHFHKFKKRQNHPSKSATFSKVALKLKTLLKVTLPSGCFSRFQTQQIKLNRTKHLICSWNWANYWVNLWNWPNCMIWAIRP